MILLGMIGPWQIVIILVIVLLLFGGKKIPQLMKGLGEGIKEFKEAKSDMEKSASSDEKLAKTDTAVK